MDFWRQLDIVSPTKLESLNITVIGAGGIGSPTVLTLAKMGVQNITVWDHDTVEDHNLPNQLYGPGHLNMTKVDALKEVVHGLTGLDITPKAEEWDPSKDSNPRGVYISAVDSMHARKTIWDFIKNQRFVSHYIEARMGGQVGWVQCVQPLNLVDMERYEKTLYTDDEADDDPCTARAIWYNGIAIAAQIAHIVKRVAMDEDKISEVIFGFPIMQLISN